MDFGEALTALKAGKRVTRAAWHEDVFLFLVPGSTFEVTADRPLGKACPQLVGQKASYGPHVDIHRADGSISVWGGPGPGGALLAEDWEQVAD
jgi:Protein of unknown function (DUF2829)